MQRNLHIAAVFAGALVALGVGSALLNYRATISAASTVAPRFEVDPMWPKPLPNHWLLGNVIGVSVDANDHVWIVHRGASLERTESYAAQKPPAAECCIPAPPVLEFDQAGNLLRTWGGPGEGYDWPAANHGLTVDFEGNVWIAGSGRATAPAGAAQVETASDPNIYGDSMVLKFSRDGRFLKQIGKRSASKGNDDTQNVRGATKLFVDPKTRELYVADGYGNRRVIVFDADSGEYKRHWGAYGHRPDDTPLAGYNPNDPPARQFRSPVHCAELSRDGLLYVCDRANDRIQIFKPGGTFVKEVFVARNTLGDGSVWDMAFSRDRQQKYIYVADGSNEKVYIIDRQSMEVLTSFGDGGRQPGQFYGVHSIATDSNGNIFTAETYRGQRVQKFVYKGLAPVTKKDQGVVWPKIAKNPI